LKINDLDCLAFCSRSGDLGGISSAFSGIRPGGRYTSSLEGEDFKVSFSSFA